MSDYGRKEKTFGSGKNIWVDVPKVYPVGGKINTSGMTLGDVIPAGSICALNTAAGTIRVYPAIYTEPVAEVDTLTITHAATADGNVTISLDGGDVSVSVAVATGDDEPTIAGKIAAKTYTGWKAVAVGAVVTFTADDKEDKGLASIVVASTGVTGSFVVTVTGADTVYTDFSSIAVNGLLYNDVIVNEYTTGTVVYEGMVFEDMLEAPIPASAKAKMPQITYFNHA